MNRVSPWYLLALALMFPSMLYLVQMERADGVAASHSYLPFLLLFGLLFVLYGLTVLRGNDKLHANIGIGAGILLRISIIFFIPAFSDDFYRFVWDGQLNLAGQNPFHFKPSELMQQWGDKAPQMMADLYGKLNSKEYYSVYPPVLQGAFTAAAWLGKTEHGTILVLKVWVVLAEMMSMWFLMRIIKRFQLPLRSILVYVLNPVVIFELTGNLHFEGFMICFLLAALWMLMLSRPLSASVFLALAIGSKLLPVLAFPFLLRRLGWGRTLLIAGLTGVMVAALFFPFSDWQALNNFRSSLSLYFNAFEFNGGIYSLGKWALGDQYFWLQRLLPWVVMALVVCSAWLERDRIWKGFAAAVMLALALYQFAAPVVHPWYIAPIVALCVLGPYRFPVIWTAFIPLTYLAYSRDPQGMPQVVEHTWVLWVEYLGMFGFLAYEALFVRRRKTLEVWMASVPFLRRWLQATIPARMKIKLHRILPLLPKAAPILDLGHWKRRPMPGTPRRRPGCPTLRYQGHQLLPGSEPRDLQWRKASL
jgi:alpha-1,6-mannosyltransferase